jgi:hypothetical protein
MRVLNPSHGLGLGAKPTPGVAAGVLSMQDHLDSHDTVQVDLPSPIYDSHSAATKLVKQLITRDRWQRHAL